MNSIRFSVVKNIFLRQQSKQPISVAVIAGIGGILAIAMVAWLSQTTGTLFLMAPFGATCVLLFSVPNSPLSQPANVIGGHVISTFVGLLMHTFLPFEWWSLGIAVGLAIMLMAVFRVTHPPAGGDPLVVFFDNPGWGFLGFPMLSGSIVLVLIAWLFHKSSNTVYPIKP